MILYRGIINFPTQELSPLNSFSFFLNALPNNISQVTERHIFSRQFLKKKLNYRLLIKPIIISLSLLPPSDHHKHRVAEKKLYGVEGSSTFLECIPKSLQARVTWTYQKQPQNPREEVRGGRLRTSWG